MRVLLESLQFQTTYDPQERVLTIEITLADSGQIHDDVSQVWSVPSAVSWLRTSRTMSQDIPD